MNVRRIACLMTIALVGALAGCTSPQAPVSFGVPPDRHVTIDDLVRALAEHGERAVEIDEAAGVVYTEWVDTGFLYGEIDEEEATIVRRYVGTISDSEGDIRIRLRMDSKRCAPDRFDIDGYVLHGRCERMNGLVSSHQEELDNLGERLQQSLVGRT